MHFDRRPPSLGLRDMVALAQHLSALRDLVDKQRLSNLPSLGAVQGSPLDIEQPRRPSRGGASQSGLLEQAHQVEIRRLATGGASEPDLDTIYTHRCISSSRPEAPWQRSVRTDIDDTLVPASERGPEQPATGSGGVRYRARHETGPCAYKIRKVKYLLLTTRPTERVSSSVDQPENQFCLALPPPLVYHLDL